MRHTTQKGGDFIQQQISEKLALLYLQKLDTKDDSPSEFCGRYLRILDEISAVLSEKKKSDLSNYLDK